MVAFPFRTEMRVVEGRVTDFRSGVFVISDQGLLIEGKSVPSFEFQLFVLFVSLLLGLAWLIVYVVLQVSRRNEINRIPWSNVHRIVLNAAERRVCVVYDAPKPGMLANKHSLTTQMEPVAYDAFQAAILPYVPGKIAEGKIKASLSPIYGVILVTLLIISVIVAIYVGIVGHYF